MRRWREDRCQRHAAPVQQPNGRPEPDTLIIDRLNPPTRFQEGLCLSHCKCFTPVREDTHFDHDYYANKHFVIVDDCVGEHIQSRVVTKGNAGGPDTPPGYHAIATILFADPAALDAAMSKLGPAIEDIPNFTNSQPEMLIGEVTA